MKKLIFTLAIVVMAVSANAQFYLGGGLNIANKNDNTTFSISPEVGYRITQLWSVGAVLGYSHWGTDLKMNSWSVEPYARFSYFNQGVVSLFLDGGVEYVSTKSSARDASVVEGFGVGIKPGIKVQISRNVSLISRFGFAGWRNDNHPGPSGFGIDTKALSLGFFYNF